METIKQKIKSKKASKSKEPFTKLPFKKRDPIIQKLMRHKLENDLEYVDIAKELGFCKPYVNLFCGGLRKPSADFLKAVELYLKPKKALDNADLESIL